MMQPGRETNFPTSSGSVQNGALGSPLAQLDGFTLTVGMVAVIILLLLLYQTYYGKRRR